ncbi:MAG: alpha/beta fold hydrolase [Terracidiphilus sp.]|nr:alpha/beta fold hydrolase [Terracidiphilus sp.]MDR3777211.1 alpha/beta fold hydrolase [Terracidiphilus sp.]
MHLRTSLFLFASSFLCGLAANGQTNPAAAVASPAAQTVTWPAVEGTTVLPNFRFGTGETLPQLTLHYLTLGKPHRNAAGHVDNAVLLLHGTGGNRRSLLNPLFSNVLFGAGAPLDIAKYFLILPDDIGHGDSAKPSDGLHAHFPAYDYDDMVRSQRMMLDEMKIDHLRLILGTSMGCMESFVWGETYPGFADALAPFACLPVPIAGRNRMMRYMAIEAIKQDPAWMGGEYKIEPAQGLRTANELSLIMGSSPLQMQKLAPTREAAEKYVENYWKRPSTDANDMIYYWNASRNYDPSPRLEQITVPVLWINSADDYINPPELGIAEKMVKRMPHARFILLPISDATRGHGTHTAAAVWKDYLAEFLRETEPKP